MKKLICAVTVLAVSTAQADTIYVDVNCPGPGNGSEAEPYCSIQTAIDNAVDTVEVIVAPGTYFEAINFLGKAVWLHSSDGPEVTVIDGTGFFHVVQCVTFEGSDTVLDGFTITGGNANGSPPDNVGGGMWNEGSSPTVMNCTFSGNVAIGGGGMSNVGSNPTVTNCTFSENSSEFDAGGMSNNNNSNPTVTNCTFSGNTSGFHGGGMRNSFGSGATLVNCAFSGNSADSDLSGGGSGGAIMSWTIGTLTLTDCTFSKNTASSSAGGIFIYDSMAAITNCSFIANTASGSSGGMMVIFSSNLTVTNCTFEGNTANVRGGGLNISDSIAVVTNCTFSGNSAGTGGGMRVFGGSLTLANCTFSGNTAPNGGGGGGIRVESSNPFVTNCILWGDSPNEIFVAGGDPNVTFSNVEGGWPGTGNINVDPLFVDPDNGDYRLQADSPCIDAGHNWAIAGIVDTDLDGNPRFAADKDDFDPGCGIPVVVDMGAYEYQGDPFPVQLGDINGDGIVGIVDFLDLLADWGTCTKDCCLSDLNLDGDVGIVDFLTLLANWTP